MASQTDPRPLPLVPTSQPVSPRRVVRKLLPPWRRRQRLVVHHMVDATGSADLVRYQRAMFGVRCAGIVLMFGVVPLYPIVHGPLLLAAGGLLASVVVAQALGMRSGWSAPRWRRFTSVALVIDLIVAFLAVQAFLFGPDWTAYVAYPFLAFEAAVFFGWRGACVTGLAIVAMYLVQAYERGILGYPVSAGHQVTVAAIFMIQASFVGVYAQVTHRVRGDLAALLRVSALLTGQESATRIVQALDAHLRDMFGGRVRSVALKRPDGGYDLVRWRTPEVRVITPEALELVARRAGRDLERDFGEHRAVTMVITPGGEDPLAVALGLPAWVRAVTLVPIHADGAQTGILPVLWESPRVPSVAVVDLLHGLADQTGIAFAQAQLLRARELAATDSLTGLANHRAFQDLLAGHLADARRRGGRVAILFCDLDRFKTINDQHGHAVGDLLLQRIAEAVRSAARDGDVVARYGGDELAVILPATDRAGAEEAGRRIRGRVRDVAHAMGVDITVGVAVFPDDAATRDALVARADAAMYAGKRQGGGRVVGGLDPAGEA